MTENKKDKKIIIYKIIAVFIALMLWQLLAMVIKLPIVLVTPVEVAKRLLTIWQVEGFWSSIGFTMLHILAGFFSGLILGIILAVLSDKSKIIEILLWPYMATFKSVPVASIVVICLLWLSNAHLSSFISFMIVLPIIYKNVLTGLKEKNKELDEAAMVNGAGWFQRLHYVTLPQLAPYLKAACSVTMGIAWKSGVAAEVIGTPNGSIGQMLFLSKIYLDTDDLLAWTVILVVLSVICEKVILLLLDLLLKKISGESPDKKKEH